MKRFLLLLVAGLAAISMVCLFGCSKDDEVTNNNNQTQFTEDDSMLIEDILSEDMVVNPLQTVELSWELLDSLPESGAFKPSHLTPAPAAADGDLTIVHAGYDGYHNGWHVFQCSVIVADDYIEQDIHYYDTVFIGGIDSIQVIADGSPVQYPSQATVVEGLKEHIHVDWSDNDGEHWGDVNHLTDVGLAYVEADTLVTLNGTVDDMIYGSEESDWGSCEVTIGVDQTVTDMVFNVNGSADCPESGQIVSVSTVDAHCVGAQDHEGDTLNVNGSWTITATVNEGQGTITFTFSNGIVSWTVTKPCDGALLQLAAGWNRRSSLRSGRPRTLRRSTRNQ